MHRLMRKLKRSASHRFVLSEEEAIRQQCLQHAMERQEEQERLRRIQQAEEEARRYFFETQAAAVSSPPVAFPPPAPSFNSPPTSAPAPFTGTGPLFPPPQAVPVTIPPWMMMAPVPSPAASQTESGMSEDTEVRRAIDASIRQEEERKRREAEEERMLMQKLREAEEWEKWRAGLQRQMEEQDARDFGQLQRMVGNQDEAAIQEAKQVQLALQMSLAEQRDGMRAEGRAYVVYQDSVLDRRGGHYELVSGEREAKGKEKAKEWAYEEDDDEAKELAEAMRLSQLVYKNPEERMRDEQAIYRSALINEQVTHPTSSSIIVIASLLQFM